MKARPAAIAVCLLLLATYINAAGREFVLVKNTAQRYFPSATWREHSLVRGDFTCSGKQELAMMGTTESEILVAVFVNGPTKKPDVLHYSASARDASTAVLSTEDLDFDANKEIGYALPGFQRSKTCKGLNLSDGRVDSAHIYWNHDAERFEDWTR